MRIFPDKVRPIARWGRHLQNIGSNSHQRPPRPIGFSLKTP